MSATTDTTPSARPHNQEEQTRARTAIPATVVHGAILGEGEAELERHPRALAWSGLAAGISMGITLLGQGLLLAYLPDAKWTPLFFRLGYPLGFLAVILGRQQLFTENTLTTLLPFLQDRRRRVFAKMARLWLIVLVANLVGAGLFAFVAARTALFPGHLKAAFLQLAVDATHGAFWPTLGGAIVAGWLIALLVWLLPAAAGESRTAVIFIFTYIIGLSGFAHIVAGSGEVLYGVAAGAIGWADYWLGFFTPALIGNVIGGVVLVAILNHEQVVAGQRRRQEQEQAAKSRVGYPVGTEE
jgi:formate-nitrite transporter family protein